MAELVCTNLGESEYDHGQWRPTTTAYDALGTYQDNTIGAGRYYVCRFTIPSFVRSIRHLRFNFKMYDPNGGASGRLSRFTCVLAITGKGSNTTLSYPEYANTRGSRTMDATLNSTSPTPVDFTMTNPNIDNMKPGNTYYIWLSSPVLVSTGAAIILGINNTQPTGQGVFVVYDEGAYVTVGDANGTPRRGIVYVGAANGTPRQAKEVWVGDANGTPRRAI